MQDDQQDRPFGEYAPEPQTSGSTIPEKPASEGIKIDAKYGIAKPRRIVVRGTVAKDTSSNNQGE